MPSINVPAILESHGPPGEWSGAVAGTLSPEERRAVLRAWRSMSAEERNTVMQKFRERWSSEKRASQGQVTAGILQRLGMPRVAKHVDLRGRQMTMRLHDLLLGEPPGTPKMLKGKHILPKAMVHRIADTVSKNPEMALVEAVPIPGSGATYLAANKLLERLLPYHGASLVPKMAAAPPVASKEQREAAARADTHFRSPDKGKWATFIENAKRKSFVKAVQQDLRSDPKFERHVDQMNRLMTGKVLGEVQGRTGKYSIIRLRGGGLGCSCADWRYKKSVFPTGEQDCKHIREWKSTDLRTKVAAASKAPEHLQVHKGRFLEGLRDEGIPMAGMVAGAFGGAALARKIPGFDAGKGAILGSGMGYAGGALANLGIERGLNKYRKGILDKNKKGVLRGMRKAADGHPATFIPGAVGATLGAAIGGGLSKDEKSKARNMLAGSALGYGAGDLATGIYEALRGRMRMTAPRVASKL